MNEPKISIIVPVYKVEKYLKKCVDSILAQTYENLEVILVDDGSPDTCPAICDEFSKKDKRIKVIHKKNGGLSDARNAGLEIATGEYIGFVDSDDFISSEMYSVLLCNLLKSKADLAICNYVRVDECGKVAVDLSMKETLKNRCFSRKEFIEELLKPYGGYYVVAWNKLYKRKIFENIRFPYGKQHEDEFIIHHIVSKCEKIVFVEEELYYYLQREGSIMSNSFNVKFMDYGDALIDRYRFTKKMKYNSWKDYCVNRLSYELEKWDMYSDNDIKIKEKYNDLRKKSLFLLFEKNAWSEYSFKGRLYMRIKLIFPRTAIILRKLLKK